MDLLRTDVVDVVDGDLGVDPDGSCLSAAARMTAKKLRFHSRPRQVLAATMATARCSFRFQPWRLLGGGEKLRGKEMVAAAGGEGRGDLGLGRSSRGGFKGGERGGGAMVVAGGHARHVRASRVRKKKTRRRWAGLKLGLAQFG